MFPDVEQACNRLIVFTKFFIAIAVMTTLFSGMSSAADGFESQYSLAALMFSLVNLAFTASMGTAAMAVLEYVRDDYLEGKKAKADISANPDVSLKDDDGS